MSIDPPSGADELLRPPPLAPQMGNPQARKVVWFLVPSEDVVGGGIMSICAIHAESRALLADPFDAVVATTYPGCPTLARFTGFENSMDIFSFAAVRDYFGQAEHIILHIPEYFCGHFLRYLSLHDWVFLRTVPRLHINILLQNIDLLAPADIEPLRALAEEITCTTAHDNYSTSEQSERFGIPLHKFSVHLNQSCFERSTWSAKENIMVLSPDANVVRDAVVAHIAANVPKLELVTVQNMSYESYKALVRRAKWSLTFGEGLDGYFAETAWTGGVPFAVFNDRFFTPDFRGLRTVYESWDALIGAIADDISALDRSDVFDTTNDAVRKPLNHLYDFGRYKDNIRAFYEERYSFGGAGRENGSLAVEAILPHVRGGAGWMRRRTELIATMRKEGRFN